MDNDVHITSWVIGENSTNVYIVNSGSSSILIDPASDAKRIIDCLNKFGVYQIDAIIATHSHHDHIGAAKDLVKYFDCSFIDFEALQNKLIFNDSKKSLVGKYDSNIGDLQVEFLYTPGHTEDSICVLLNDRQERLIKFYNQVDYLYGCAKKDKYESINTPILFSGDTLFYNSHIKSNYDINLIDQTKITFNLLRSLPKETLVFPGHGRHTNIGFEIDKSLLMF